MTALDVTFETAVEPQTFAHIRSSDGVLGHAQEVRDRIPSGTWLCIQPAYQPTVTAWLIRKCEFDYHGKILVAGEFNDLLRRR